jgi:DNA-binding MarR family transcriptional regulator
VERDGRLKRILLTEKAIEIHHHIQRHLETVDEKITKGISQEEMEVFYSLVNRMKANLEDMKKTDGDKRSSL